MWLVSYKWKKLRWNDLVFSTILGCFSSAYGNVLPSLILCELLMVRRGCILVLLLLNSLWADAQYFGQARKSDSLQAVDRTYGILATSGGIAAPTGAFAIKDLSEPGAGFARLGYTINYLGEIEIPIC